MTFLIGPIIWLLILCIVLVSNSKKKKRKMNQQIGRQPVRSGGPRSQGPRTAPNMPDPNQYTIPKACEDDHGYCSHISTKGKYKDFEDRENDWLAKQMAEERKALYRIDQMLRH